MKNTVENDPFMYAESVRYINPDGERYFNEVTHEFLLPFDKTQKYALRYALEHNFPADVIAYPYISGERMIAIVNNMANGMEGCVMGDRFITRMDAYKCGQLDIGVKKTELIAEASYRFIKVIDIFDDVTKVSDEALELLCTAARERVFLISPKAKHLRAEDFNKKASSIYKRKMFLQKIQNIWFWIRQENM